MRLSRSSSDPRWTSARAIGVLYFLASADPRAMKTLPVAKKILRVEGLAARAKTGSPRK